MAVWILVASFLSLLPATYTISAISGAVPTKSSVNLKFNIDRYTNKPTNKKPSLTNVFTALEAATETCVVVNVILFIS